MLFLFNEFLETPIASHGSLSVMVNFDFIFRFCKKKWENVNIVRSIPCMTSLHTCLIHIPSSFPTSSDQYFLPNLSIVPFIGKLNFHSSNVGDFFVFRDHVEDFIVARLSSSSSSNSQEEEDGQIVVPFPFLVCLLEMSNFDVDVIDQFKSSFLHHQTNPITSNEVNQLLEVVKERNCEGGD